MLTRTALVVGLAGLLAQTPTQQPTAWITAALLFHLDLRKEAAFAGRRHR
jgi:hypothetical protein